MAAEDNRRSVSGEIMTVIATPPFWPKPSAIVEAEYETFTPTGGRNPEMSPPSAAVPRGMTMLRSVGGRVGRAARGGPVFWGAGLMLVAVAFWISGGHTLIDRVGPIVTGTPKQPLIIEKATHRVEARGARAVLIVEGATTNRGVERRSVPPIAIAITDSGGLTSRHFLGTNGTLLAPGQSIAFSSRVEAPSNGVKSVTVTFREE
ncbi:hypothetical protein GRZ55_02255 [Chelativorans sp. ZYF759]|uniref:hypothetical protein n=1 Tax=Chelativorans sp. ZYF759 TaxID=2692213 RepID=UPI00145FC7B6|nr:hypothetical protein [Chelativorans sp. ZYF759]NMG38061.1 hypothetical protein [Chelativorans sp. ZYF759]